MIQVFLLYILFAPVLGLERNCLKQNFIDKSSESHPKWGVKCSDTEVENRWREQLIYEKLEGNSGIRIKWKFLIQKPSCALELKFLGDDRESKSIFPQRKSHNSDWIELTERNNFELKVQAHYFTGPKCFEATKTIILKNNVIPTPTSTPALPIILEEDKNSFTLLPPVPLPAFNEHGIMKKDENWTVVKMHENEETAQETMTADVMHTTSSITVQEKTTTINLTSGSGDNVMSIYS